MMPESDITASLSHCDLIAAD